MARTTPADRLDKLIAVAAAAFVAHGFQRTQMDDIAVGLGVSKGTVYRSVDSKESLLAAVLKYADTPDLLPSNGPIEQIRLEHLSSMLRDQLATAVGGTVLATTAAAANTVDGLEPIGDEIERVAADLYAMMAAHRVRIMVLDRCAAEVPELAGNWYQSGRYAVVELFVQYLGRRAEQIGSAVDHDVLARTIVELITLWAVKMPWDPAPHPYPSEMAGQCAAMIRDLVTGPAT